MTNMNTRLRTGIAALVVATTFWAQPTLARDLDSEEQNKALVLKFYQELFGDKDVTAIDRYVAEGYIQHNPTVPTGRAAVRSLFGNVFAGAPKTKVDIRRVAADGDLVWLHVRSPGPTGRLSAIVDIFRVKDGRIVEHWDVIQPVPSDAANNNTMF
jgi:predicted SnoaL-like aldol condensation-catalyzing enzyme